MPAKKMTKTTAKATTKTTVARTKPARRGKPIPIDPNVYQAKVPSYPQRRIMHAAEWEDGMEAARTLCGYVIGRANVDKPFSSKIENACQRCSQIVENRRVHEW